VLAFARYAEARIAKWVQFQGGSAVSDGPGDLESGWFYLLDRVKRVFYSLDIEQAGGGGIGG